MVGGNLLPGLLSPLCSLESLDILWIMSNEDVEIPETMAFYKTMLNKPFKGRQSPLGLCFYPSLITTLCLISTAIKHMDQYYHP